MYSEVWEGEEEKKNPCCTIYFQFHENIICLLQIFFCYYEKLVGEKYYVCAYGCVFVHLQLLYATIFRLV